MTFIHLADVHLGAALTHVSYDALKAQDLVKAMWETFEKTLLQSVGVFLIAGDLIEGQTFDYFDQEKLLALLALRPDAEFFWALGNHDAWDRTSNLRKRLPENVKVFPPDQLSYFDAHHQPLRVFGMSYQSFNRYGHLPDRVDLAPDRMNILVLHANADLGPSDHLDLRVRDLEAMGFDYIALGHIHKPTRLSDRAAYPGILEPRDFGEPGPHGFIRGKWQDGLTLEFHPVASFCFSEKTLQLGPDRLEDQLRQALSAYGPKDFVRLVLRGSARSEDLARAIQRIQMAPGQVYVEFCDQTKPVHDLAHLRSAHRDDLVGGFIRAMDAHQEDPLYGRALEMGLNLILEAME